jgi:hypothetical protein
MASIIKANQLQDFGGNSIITSDGSGNLTTQKLLYPAFEAYIATDQTSIADNTPTKTQFDAEAHDTNNCYSTSTSRFTPNVAGKYYVYSQIFFGGNSNADIERVRLDIYKNGSRDFGSDRYLRSQFNGGGQNIEPDNMSLNITSIIDMNGTTDYLEIYGTINTHDGTDNGIFYGRTNGQSAFSAFRIGS